MTQFTNEHISEVGATLLNVQKPLKERFRALFTLKNIGGPLSIKFIEQCFTDDSCLLKHELAYCLGQMQDKLALPVLGTVLEDLGEEPMVRHEAAEAIGAIGDQTSIPILERFLMDPSIEVRETCEIAIDRIKWLNQNKEADSKIFGSVDPAPSWSETSNVKELETILTDKSNGLFKRYQAMFALRDLAAKSTENTKAVEALGKALVQVDSALFRHELAFVLGQLQHPGATEYLKKQLGNVEENEMVRHECAEALGAIATPHSMGILNEFLRDEKRVVKESCEVALDVGEYFSGDDFQYANTLSK